MAQTLLERGLLLMLTGMGTVFFFLSVLVLAMNLMSRLLALLPAPAATPVAGAREQEVAAITAAIRMHRTRKKNR